MDAPASRKWILVAVAALLALAAASGLRSCWLGLRGSLRAQAQGGALTGLSLPGLLGDSSGGFLKVMEPRPFRFPADHGPHAGYRTEWWYFTGNLEDNQGRDFGYQLTFFRSGLRPPGDTAARASAWAAGDAWMAHFALTDPGDAEGRRFHAFERFSRGALGLAGARAGGGAGPFRVWLEDWSAAAEPAGNDGDTAFLPLRLKAAQGSIALDLRLSPGKPLALQGDRGYSAKGKEPGNASHYYSFTRLPTTGSLTTGAGTFAVTGASWLDREWGSSILAPGLAGWEWFALQLADSTEWMFFRLRPAGKLETGPVRFDYGMRVDSRGGTTTFAPEAMAPEILSTWESPRGRAYPARWRIVIPSAGVTLEIAPRIADQELALSIPYWEGAVTVRGSKGGAPLSGQGYMELTGF